MSAEIPGQKSIEKIRLSNLKMLITRVSKNRGWPIQEQFSQALGIAYERQKISNLFCEEHAISSSIANDIEIKLALPTSWLSEDHEYLFEISHLDNKLIKQIMSLSNESKEHLIAFIESLKTTSV